MVILNKYKYIIKLIVLIFLVMIFSGFNSLYATDKDTIQYSLVEYDKPEPIGGMEAIKQKIEYPFSQLQLGEEGYVVVKALINEKGDVIKISVLESSNKLFNKPILNAIKTTKFIPAKQNSIPIKFWVRLKVEFKTN